MASVKKIDGKTGTTYKLTVTKGRDMDGKQIRHYRTFTPAPGMTERQAAKASQRAALDFERELELGYQADNRQTFSAYAEYVLDLKTQSGCKLRTITSYRDLLKQINPIIGNMKLAEIRAQHLNRLYKALASEGARRAGTKARPVGDVAAVLKARKMTQRAASALCGISPATVSAMCCGQTVNAESAEKLCRGLNVPLTKYFVTERDTRPLSGKTVLEYHRFIHTILAQAVKEMVMPYNAADKATPPKQERKEVNYFQPEDLPRILDALDTEPIKWRTLVNLLIVTGCRRGEVAALKWSKVDFKNSRITIDATMVYTPERGIQENATKTADIRFLKLPAETMKLLRDYRQAWIELSFKLGDKWPGLDYLFIRDDGKLMMPDTITAWLANFSKRHNLPHINPHAFRHTAASVLINNGQDIVTVSRRLGHAHTSTTLDIYSHLIAQADADASECIADTLLRRQA